MSLLYEEAGALTELDAEHTQAVDLVKRIHELTARNVKCMVEHRGLSEYVTTQSHAYKQFYEGYDVGEE